MGGADGQLISNLISFHMSKSNWSLAAAFSAMFVLVLAANLFADAGKERRLVDLVLAGQADGVLVLDAGSGERRYHKELRLPVPVRGEGARAQLRNGVFELCGQASGSETFTATEPIAISFAPDDLVD